MSEAVFLRVERPYATESELLQSEGWTVTKKSVYLIGIEPHPEGEWVRCELALASGLRLLVAEGVVIRHMVASAGRPSGLVVRYRRLSSASSEFIGRALNAREAGDPSSSVGAEAEAPPPSSNLETPLDSTPLASELGSACASASSGSQRMGDALDRHGSVLSRLGGRLLRPSLVPPDRDSVLRRLRTRAVNSDG